MQKLAPNYKGKPKNFVPDPKLRKERKPRPVQKRNGPKGPELTPPTHLDANKTPTPQRNESIISEAIFGIDVSVTAIEPQQHFDANFSRLVDLTMITYQNMIPDVKQLDRLLIKEELSYYATALLWLRLIDLKSKQRLRGLTSQEKDILKATKDITWNVPQPIYGYLSQIGNIVDRMGKETLLNVPNLPITVVQGFGGYHAAAITQASHNLFEEIPSLGIAADVVMASTSPLEQPEIDYRVAPPVGAVFTPNLIGSSVHIGPRRAEIRQRLNGLGITENAFPEYVANTRFNLVYLLQISDILTSVETFRIEKMNIASMTLHGGETMVIQTLPNEDEDLEQRWIQRTVQAQSPASDSTAQIGASYVFGFQLHKATLPNPNAVNPVPLATRAANWSCIQPTAGQEPPPWVMPVAWEATKNKRL